MLSWVKNASLGTEAEEKVLPIFIKYRLKTKACKTSDFENCKGLWPEDSFILIIIIRRHRPTDLSTAEIHFKKKSVSEGFDTDTIVLEHLLVYLLHLSFPGFHRLIE